MRAQVTLTVPELMVAGFVAVMRRGSALKANRPTAYQYDATTLAHWGNEVGGTASEMGVAKHLDRYWSPLAPGRLSELPGDVSEGIQVRSTERRDGCLILHEEDADDHLFYLAITAGLPSLDIIGPIRAGDAKDKRYWRSAGVRHPAFFLPQEAIE